MMILEPIQLTGEYDPSTACRGMCPQCGREHALPVGPAYGPALALFHRLEQEGRLDFTAPKQEVDPRLSTEYLYGPARGQMFGVLVVRDQVGDTFVLKAFSGQYNSLWQVKGWVDPLLDVKRFRKDTFEEEIRIKLMGSEIAKLPSESSVRQRLVRERKKASQVLMQKIHAMFRLPNFRDKCVSLPLAVFGKEGVPTGTGDCCAPKLLGCAAAHGLTPLGLAEFYFGRSNRSGTKHHGEFYPSCQHKCGRILGYMLCGLENKNDN
ncbi:hypothetical protein [uncultured Pseudodesulfovibrio sp.]|uniref:hypothetical protein n=1 Tax=uncultured Pseudodesulfovibrio sp. TaxID=2035858 RepID=UPI0029C866F6|nr:hypothetical protein [uncultured Pseudodesulfovibrio sp.]